LATIPCFKVSNHITQLYSSKGLTYVRKARISRVLLRETKQRKIAFALWCAFPVTSHTMCIAGDKLLLIVTPRSRQEVTLGTGMSFLLYLGQSRLYQ